MVAPVAAPYVKVFQAEKVVWVPTIANIFAPTVAELTAAAGVDMSCALFDDVTRPSQATNRITFARRLCAGAVAEGIGQSNYSGGDIQYAYSPQGATGDGGRAVAAKLPNGTTGFLVWRLGIPYSTDFAAGQEVSVFPVAFGPQMAVPHGDGESAEAAIMQTYAVTSVNPGLNVKVAS